MTAALVCAALVCTASTMVGAGVARAAGCSEWRGWMPPLGLASLMVLCLLAVALPGHGATAAVMAVIAAASGGFWGRSALRALPWRECLPVAVLLLAVACVPFAVSGRFGPLGQSVNLDLAFHMTWADWLGEGRSFDSSGYPLGPHAVVAALSFVPGVGADAGFTGVLMAVPALTGLCALSFLVALPLRLRVLAALMAGFPYLCAAYYAQASFKEPLLALFFLAAVGAVGERRRSVEVVALVLLAAGALACFSAPALVWIAAAALSGVIVRRGVRIGRRAALAAGGLAALALLATIPTGFFSSGAGRYLFGGSRGPGGNFRGQLNPLEVLGVWPSPDFQVARSGAVWTAALAVGGMAAAAGLWAWRRREHRLPAVSLLIALALALAAALVTIPYLSAKALVVAAPLLLVVVLLGLLDRPPDLIRGLGCALFIALAAHSSLLALRGAAVEPPAAGAELDAMRPLVSGQPTLFLGDEPYAAWHLRDARLATVPRSVPGGAARAVAPRPEKQAGAEKIFADFDSPPDPQLARVRYVVAPNTAYASRPPRGFELVRDGRRYLLFRREGPLSTRYVLPEGAAPGTVLRCGAGAVEADGMYASSIPAPVRAAARGWRQLNGALLRIEGSEAVLPPTYIARMRVRLPPGRWRVALTYRARFDTEAKLDGRVVTLPAFLGDRFSPLSLGDVSGGREVTVEVTGAYRSGGAANVASFLGALTAARVDASPQMLPLRRACGRYVDYLTR